MSPSQKPIILLVTDEPSEESHTSHILGKYHFDNSLVKLRKSGETIDYFLQCNAPEKAGPESVPELIIYSLRDSGRLNLSPIHESRRGALGGIPLIIVVESPAEEEEIRKLRFPNTALISRPVGFFKLLEAMQKLEMRWIVLKPKR
jgi:hypothetical protein